VSLDLAVADKLAVFGTHGLAGAFAREGRKMGVEMHCFAHPMTEDARRAFDVCHDVSLTNTQELIALCRQSGTAGILHTSEFTFYPAAQVAAALGLEGLDPANARLITDKYRNRQCCAKVEGLAPVEFERIENVKDIGERWVHKMPFIVKPTSEAGKRGVALVHTEQELRDALAYIEHEPNRGAAYIVESLIPDGINLSIEGLSYQGTHNIIQVTSAVIDTAHHCSELAHQQPAQIGKKMRHRVIELDKRVLDAVGLTFGPSHTEMRIVGEDIYLIEVNARGGGDLISERLVELSTGYNLVQGIIEAALGKLEPIDTNALHHWQSGIWYLCEQTANFMPVFEESAHASWCPMRYAPDGPLTLLTHNGEDHGYFVYQFKDEAPQWVQGWADGWVEL
jgi:biotin carboxylase